MARRLFSAALLACLVLVWPVAGRNVNAQQPALPQDAPPPTTSDAPPPNYETPPAITLVDGSARLIRQGQSQSAVASMPLVEGDRIATEDGRVAVTFPDGTLLHIDRNTSVDFLSMSLVRMLDGRVILVVAGRGGERATVDYQVDAPAGSVRVETAGEYKVATLTREVELDVVTGSASLATDQGSVRVAAGERAFAAEGDAPSEPQAFNSARLDEFDEWSDSQRAANTEEAGGRSAEYLPSDLNAYSGTFDHYGRWESDPTYGNVWYPTVRVGWRPYYNGYWDYVGPYGWTWIGYDRWAWPTHHFGRWGFRAGLWFWIPQRHWGPAWVSWAYSPGYYGWCPLDFYNRPIISFFFGSHFGFRGSFDPWLCWTVLPRHRFGPGFRVASYAVLGSRLAAGERSAFVVRRTGPERPLAFARSGSRFGGDARATAMPRALSGIGAQARPRDGVFSGSRTASRSGAAASLTTPRTDRRSLPFSSPGQRYERSGATPGAVTPRGSFRSGAASEGRSVAPGAAPRAVTPRGSFRSPAPSDSRSLAPGASPRGLDNRPPASRVTPRGFDRPSAPTTQPRGDSYAAPRYSPPSRSQSPGYSAPRYSAPSSPRSSAPAAPRYSTPPRSESPRYSAPAAPRYSAPATPRYSAPQYSRPSNSAPQYSRPSYSAPQYSRPSYSAPAAPSPRSYSAPSAPRYSAPTYSAPRSAPSAPRYSAPSYSAPRSAPSAPRYSAPSSSAPRSAPSASPRMGGGGGGAPRSAPSGSPRGGDRGGRRR